MSWERMDKVITRYERIVNTQLKEVKELQRKVMSTPDSESSSHLRQQIGMLEERLLSDLKQMMAMRMEISEDSHNMFDQKIDLIRKQIEAVMKSTQLLPTASLRNLNPFDDDNDAIQENIYEEETKRYALEKNNAIQQAKMKMEEAKATAEATANIQRDMRDLEEIFAELATMVHQQHDMVDSIEEHVERATIDVQRGNEQLKSAVKHQTAKTGIMAGVVGGLAVGGPVGVAAGSAVAGVAAGVGGLVAGLYGGRWFRNAARKQCEANTEKS